MIRKIAYASAVALAVGGLGLTAAAANAAPAAPRPNVVVGTNYQSNLAGYQVFGNGSQKYNEVRGTVTLPASENSTVAGGTVAIGMIMQEDVNGGQTAGMGFVYNAKALDSSITCSSTQWTLMAGTAFDNPIGPIPLDDLDALLNDSAVPVGSPDYICLNGGQSYYLEIHYSTHDHTVAFLAGPNEFNDVSQLLTVQCRAFDGFENPAIGTFVDSGLEDLTDGSVQGSWTRDGLTQPAGFNTKFGKAGARIPFAYPSTQLVESTVSGGAPTPGNVLTLFPSAFGTGASFSVSVP
jgi:hypothetical protein